MQAVSPLQAAVSRLPQQFSDDDFDVIVMDLASQAQSLTASLAKGLPERHGLGLLLTNAAAIIERARTSSVHLESRASSIAALVDQLFVAIPANVRMDAALNVAVVEAMKGSHRLRAELLRRKGRR